MEAADTVVALKGWTHSQGAQIEWAYAQRTGKRRLTLAQFCEENHIRTTPFVWVMLSRSFLAVSIQK